MDEKNTRIKTTPELRRFGLIMAVALLLLGILLIWRSRPVGPYLLGIAALFALAGLIAPRLLAPFEKGWMALARVLSIVMTTVVLTVTFFLVITPVGLVKRLLSGDTLGLTFEAEIDSYWIPIDPQGPSSRPDKPF